MACEHLAALIKTQEEFYDYDQKQLEKMKKNLAENCQNTQDKIVCLEYIDKYEKQIKQTKAKLNDCYKMARIV